MMTKMEGFFEAKKLQKSGEKTFLFLNDTSNIIVTTIIHSGCLPARIYDGVFKVLF